MAKPKHYRKIENHEDDQDDYETIIRFPNLSSIAAARFIGENPQKTKQYWQILNGLIKKELPEKRDLFASRTRRRPLHIPKSDRKINPNSDQEQNLKRIVKRADGFYAQFCLKIERKLSHKSTGRENVKPD